MRLLEVKQPNIIVVYGGGFQPFHEGHASSYREAKAAFPGAYFFIAASNVTSERPFEFKEKQFLAKQAGVVDPFIQVGTMSYVNDNGRKVTSTPLNPLEVLQKFNPEKDVLIIVRSKRDPMKTTDVSYYQPWQGLQGAEPFSKHAYVFVTKKHDFSIAGNPVYSGSQVRELYSGADDKTKLTILQDLYPQSRQLDKIKKIFDKRLAVNEGWKGAAIGGALGYHFGNHYAAMLGAALGHLAGEFVSAVGKRVNKDMELIKANIDVIDIVVSKFMNSLPKDKYDFPIVSKQVLFNVSTGEENALATELLSLIEDELIRKYGKQIAYKLKQDGIDSLLKKVADNLFDEIVELDKTYKKNASTDIRDIGRIEPKLESNDQKTFTVVYYSKKTDRNVTKTIKANNQSQVWDKLKSKGIDVVSVKEQGLNEFAPGNGGGESGRWYTDDQMTDLVGDGWWNDLDVSGDVSKQEMIQEAQAWLDDQGYSVHVLNCKVNDDDMEWFIEGSFQNSSFAKKDVDEASLATMRDYFAGDKNAQDPTTLAKQRNWFDANKDTTGRPTVQKKFRSRAEYEQWLKQNKLKQISDSEEYNIDEEAANLLEYLRKIHKRWAIVSKKEGRPLVYFKGDGRPSKEWVEKQERRINHLKHKK